MSWLKEYLDNQQEKNHYLGFLREAVLTAFTEGGLRNVEFVNTGYEKIAGEIGRVLDLKLRSKQREKIGTTISSSTIERFIRGVDDNFSVNTLNKLSVYSGYASWTAFKANRKSRVYKKPIKSKITLKQYVLQAVKYEMEAYKSFEEVDVQALQKIYLPGSKSLSNFYNLLKLYKNAGLKLLHVDISISDMDVLLSKKIGTVRAKEFYSIVWLNQNNGEQTQIRWSEIFIYDFFYIEEFNLEDGINKTGWILRNKYSIKEAYSDIDALLHTALTAKGLFTYPVTTDNQIL